MKNQKLIIILLVAILCILLIPYLLLGAVFGISFSQMRKHPLPAPTEQVSSGDPELDLELDLMAAGKQLAASRMPGFEIGWTYDAKTKTGNINAFRSDYSGYFLENAQSEPEAYLPDWNNSVERARAAQKAVQQYFAKSEADDITVIVNILDYDEKKLYLSVANGIVGYDAVNGIDLRSQGSG